MAEYTLDQLGLGEPVAAPVKQEYTPEDLGFFGEVGKTLKSPKRAGRALLRSVTEGPLAEAGGEIGRTGIETVTSMRDDPLGTLAGVGPGLVEAAASIPLGMGIMSGAGLR